MPKRQLLRWRVIRIQGARAQEICVVEAVDEKAAVKFAIREYGIVDPQQQRRLAARPED